jgi:hypothetical protein
MATIALPASVKIRSISWTLDRPAQVNRSAYTGVRRVVANPWHGIWKAQVQLAPILGESNVLAWRAFLASLKGQINNFHLPATEGPQNSNTGVTVYTTAAAGLNHIQLAGITTALAPGQMITVNGQLLMIVSVNALDTSTHTQGISQFEPALRAAATTGTPVATANPYALVALADSAFQWSVDPGKQYGISFSVEEAIGDTDEITVDLAPTIPVTKFVLAGDSQTANSGAYADQIIPDLTALGITCTKVAAGSRILGVSTDTSSVNSAWGHVSEVIAAAPDVVSHWLGHNDFGTYTASNVGQYFTNTLAYFAHIKAALPNVKIIWIVPTNAGSNWVGDFTNMNAFIAALRPLIRAGVDGTHYDAFADFGAYPEFVDNLNANTSDGLHVAVGASSGYLKSVLRAVADGFINHSTSTVPAAFDLGSDLTGVPQSSTETMDIIVSGLAPNVSLTGASVTGGQMKQGFGSYGTSIGSGGTCNGDTFRIQATTSASLNTTTTVSVTEQPGSVTDSRSFTTVATGTRSPPSSFTSSSEANPSWITLSNGNLSAQGAVDVGAPMYVAIQQAFVGSRNNYCEVTINAVGATSSINVALIDSTLEPLGTAVPGQTGNPSHGMSYRGDAGVVWLNAAFSPTSGGYTLFSAPGDTVGICTKDNGDGTTQVWFLDKNGLPLVSGDVEWSSGGKHLSVASSALLLAVGVRNGDKVTINCIGPFAHKTASQLTAASAKAVDAT